MFGPTRSVSHRDVLWLCIASSSNSRGSVLAIVNTIVRIRFTRAWYPLIVHPICVLHLAVGRLETYLTINSRK